MVDCGFPAREIEARLAGLGVDPESLAGILVTHEHVDHRRGVGTIARRYRLPVWMTPGTHHAADYGLLPRLHRIDCHAGCWSIGDLEIFPYPVPHDSREPCQFTFRTGQRTLGLLTDTGHITPHILTMLRACDSLILEFNHDPQMLVNGPYPVTLQARVGGAHGHLSNHQALGLLNGLPYARLHYLVASHLSEKNNSPRLVKALIAQHLPELAGRLSIASQQSVSDWYEF
ncbi:MAG: MBL fold metallo-hydrolase [Candidatus Thiodiazotropha sp. (ex Epidulcina cf. delphinae)]|nr:MBL fold metallo-hydrolase [Candidatus Thiodiazotropha sp. (ex Epidulcina cf. delphinae)]